MARRRALDKYRVAAHVPEPQSAPQPEPQPEQQPEPQPESQPEFQLEPGQVLQTPAEGQVAPAASVEKEPEEKAFESERLMLFGPPGTQKNILILAIVGLLFSGIVYYASPAAKENAAKGLQAAPMIFVMIHGALTGMLLGQFILVYPDRIIILFTLMSMLVAETIFGAVTWGGTEKFVYNRSTFGIILAILFWGGFVGFWIGFAFYAKRLSDRKRFQRRISSV
jgi:hypothetical protein